MVETVIQKWHDVRKITGICWRLAKKLKNRYKDQEEGGNNIQ